MGKHPICYYFPYALCVYSIRKSDFDLHFFWVRHEELLTYSRMIWLCRDRLVQWLLNFWNQRCSASGVRIFSLITNTKNKNYNNFSFIIHESIRFLKINKPKGEWRIVFRFRRSYRRAWPTVKTTPRSGSRTPSSTICLITISSLMTLMKIGLI